MMMLFLTKAFPVPLLLNGSNTHDVATSLEHAGTIDVLLTPVKEGNNNNHNNIAEEDGTPSLCDPVDFNF